MTKRLSDFLDLEQELKQSEHEYYVGSLMCYGALAGDPIRQQFSSQFLYPSSGFGYGDFSHPSGNIFGQLPIMDYSTTVESAKQFNPFPSHYLIPMGLSEQPQNAQKEDKQETFVSGEELVPKDYSQFILQKQKGEHLGCVSLRDTVLSEIFKEAPHIQGFRLRYFVQNGQIEKKSIRPQIKIRIEIYLKQIIFDEAYRRKLQQNEDRIIKLKQQAKELRKEGSTCEIKNKVSSLEQEATTLQDYNNLAIAHRQLVIKVLRMAAVRINEAAIIKPEFSKDLTTRLFLLKDNHRKTKWNKKGFEFEPSFDQYCLNKANSRAIGKYIKNLRELRYFLRSNKKTCFKRTLCSPEVLPHLSQIQQAECREFEVLFDNQFSEGSQKIVDLIMDYLGMENQALNLDVLKEEDPEALEELRKEIIEQDRKLDKTLEIRKNMKMGSNSGLTGMRFYERPTRYAAAKQKITEKRLMSKLASRNKNKYAFDEFEDEIKNIREYPTPNKIATQLMPHQAQALTWMKYREQKLSSKFVLRENYKGSVIPKDRALSVYWEEIKLIDGKTFYINYFTGEFSTRPTYSKVVQGGILAHDMGLGKTLIVLSLIYDDEMDTFTRPKKGVLTGKNLYVTVGTVIPNEIENLLRKHVKPPLKYIIIDKDNRKLSKPLQDYDIVIVSYQTLKSEFKQFQLVGYTNKQEEDEYQSSSKFQDIVKIEAFCQNQNGNIQEQMFEEFQLPKAPLHKGRLTIFGYYWNRIVLDQAHHIRNRDTLNSEATCALRGRYRWCLTGTPVQNNKTEVYALLKFLRVEIFSEWKWWNRYIEKSESLEDGFSTLHKVLRKIMLTKSKNAKDCKGEAIIALPDKHQQDITIEFSQQEGCAYELMREVAENFICDLIEKKKKKNLTAQQKKQNKKDSCNIFTLMMKLRQFCDDPCLAIPGFSKKTTQDNIKGQIQRKLLAKIAEEADANELLEEDLCVRCKFQDENLITLRCTHKICLDCIEQGDADESNCPVCFRPPLVVRQGYRIMREESDTSTVFPFSAASVIFRRPIEPPVVRPADVRPGRLSRPIIPQQQLEQDQPKEEKYYSAKLLRLIGLVLQILDRGEKCIVFSQWIRVMQRISEQLQWHNIKVICLNSKLKISERRQQLEHFIHSDIQVLVTSLKSSGQGLNLSVASSVIIVDPDWNPTIQQQGIDRTYRFGQTRNVSVYRLLMSNSIEQKLRELHQKKIHQRNYTMMDKQFFKGKKYIEKMLNLVSKVA